MIINKFKEALKKIKSLKVFTTLKMLFQCCIFIILILICVITTIGLFNSFYFMSSCTFGLAIFTLFLLFFKFRKEMELFFVPSKKLVITSFNINERNKKIILDVFNRNLDNLEKFGLLQLTTFIGIIIGGIRFGVFNYVSSAFEANKITSKNYPEIQLDLNADFSISSLIIIVLAVIFYIYKINFVNKSRIIIDEIKNETICDDKP